VASRQSNDLITPAVEERIGGDEKRASALLNKQREGGLEIALGRRIRNVLQVLDHEADQV
jgi:hypothetical protein